MYVSMYVCMYESIYQSICHLTFYLSIYFRQVGFVENFDGHNRRDGHDGRT